MGPPLVRAMVLNTIHLDKLLISYDALAVPIFGDSNRRSLQLYTGIIDLDINETKIPLVPMGVFTLGSAHA